MILSLATLIDRYTRDGRICPLRKLEQVIDDYILQSEWWNTEKVR